MMHGAYDVKSVWKMSVYGAVDCLVIFLAWLKCDFSDSQKDADKSDLHRYQAMSTGKLLPLFAFNFRAT